MSDTPPQALSTCIVEMELNPLKLKEHVRNLDRCFRELMQKDTDYGTIPGTLKPTLYKPGAEILCLVFNLRPETEILSKVEDFESPYFDYTVKASLWSRKYGFKVGDGVGSANTMESRYSFRWMWSNEVPQDFDKEKAVKRTAKTGSVQYRREASPDEIYTMKNTVLKMGEKRAFVDAVLRCTGASRIFTQDVEDVTDVEVEEEKPTVKIPPMPPTQAKSTAQSKPVAPETVIPAMVKRVLEHKIQFFLDGTRVDLPVSKMNEGRIKFLREVFAAKQSEYGITIREVVDSSGNIRELETDDVPEKIFEELERNIVWALTGSLNVDASKIAVRVVK